LEEVMRDHAFTTHTYKHTTMGFIADIEAMPDQMDYAKTFFDRWYRPQNATVIVAGDVDPAKVIPLVEKYWSSWKKGDYTVNVPREPEPKGPIYAHVPWPAKTSPLVVVGFHGPAFSETDKDSVALDLLQELWFGSTSDLYQKLVVTEQKVNSLSYDNAASQDPSLTGIMAELFDAKDALYVRDEILKTCALARADIVDAQRLAQAKSNNRYGFARALDNTEAIAGTLARYVRFRRSYDTLNNLFKLYDTLTPADLLAAAQKYFRDERMVVTTLSFEPLVAEIEKQPALASFTASGDSSTTPGSDLEFVVQKSPNRQLNLKLQFMVGSARDPQGKEGLASLAAAMISEAGSSQMRIDEIEKRLFPIAGGFGARVDREMTTFSGAIHADNLAVYADTVLPQLLSPGWREEDFTRLKQNALNDLVQNLRTNNDEELGKEALQAAIYAGSGYGHPSQGTVAGIESITLDDIKKFVADNFTRANLVVGLAGDVPDDFQARLRRDLGKLPAGASAAAIAKPTPAAAGKADAAKPAAHQPSGIEVDIIQKETRATAISFGEPLDVVRGDPDFVALYLARTWLGEHRSSMSHLYQRIREVRGMNYGDYAYVEAFRGGGFQFFPAPNDARRAQLFEVWIRPVKPETAHHALRIAIDELDRLVESGMSQEDFAKTREYLSKNVFLMTASQSQQLGYALDSRFYGTPEYTKYMRDGLAKLTLADVNAALKKHLSAKNLRVVCVTKDAEGLKQQLLSDAPSSMTYESTKPQELLDDDKRIGARKLAIKPENLRVIPVESVFAK
jgi:zinc protease